MRILDLKKRPLQRGFALFTLIAYLSHSSVWAAPGIDISSLQKSDEIAAQTSPLLIPVELGRITEKTSDRPRVYLIQDAHGQYHAQKSSEAILDFLAVRGKISSVLIEGGGGKLEPSKLAFFQEAGLNLKIADTLMRISQTGGAERFMLKNPGKISAYGVDDLPLYLKNLKLYQRVSAYKKETDLWTRRNFTSLFAQASRKFNKPLFDFFKEYTAYEEERSELFGYLQQLEKRASENLGHDFKNPKLQLEWPMMVRFFELKRREPLLKLKEAEKQRADLIRWIVANNLPKNLSEGLREDRHTPDFDRRLFWEHFFETASASGFKFENYPELFLLEGHLILEGEIDFTSLQDEIRKLQEDLLSFLIKTPQEKSLFQSYRDALTLKKVFSLSLTREEYLEFSRKTAGVQLPPELKAATEASADFYKTALERDEAMLKNITAALDSLDGNLALIAGGFHTRGLCDYFLRKNIPYAVISPHISVLENNSNYGTAMTGGQTRIDFGASSVRVPSWMQAWTGSYRLPEAVELQRGEIEKRIYEYGAKQNAHRVGARSELRAEPDQLLGRQFKLNGKMYEITEFITRRQNVIYIYKAVDLETSLPVAVKIFNDFRNSSRRFTYDARALAVRELEMTRRARGPKENRNPYVPGVGDLVDVAGYPALITDYISGRTLDKWREEKTPEEALEKAAALLKALRSIHEKEMLHKDFKPQNVMITDKGKIKVIDFGSAKLMTDLGDGSDTAPLYAAPELLTGGEYQISSELYSAGLVLYELAAGERLFTSKTTTDLRKEKNDSDFGGPELTTRLENAGAQVWLPLAPVLVKALANSPEERYQTAAEMLADIERIISGRSEIRTAEEWGLKYLPGKNPYTGPEEAWEVMSRELKIMVADSDNPLPENEFNLISTEIARYFEKQGWEKPYAFSPEMGWWQTSFDSEHYLASEKRLRMLAWPLLDTLQRIDFDIFQALAFAFHLKRYGAHLDGDKFLDHELLINSIRRFLVQFVAQRGEESFQAELNRNPFYKEVRTSLSRDTFMLWAVAVLLDPAVYDVDMVRLYQDIPRVEEVKRSGADISIPFFLKKIFQGMRKPGLDGELTGDLLSETEMKAIYNLAAEALAKTDSDWQALGLIKPSRMRMKNAYLTWADLSFAARQHRLQFLDPIYNLPISKGSFSIGFQAQAVNLWREETGFTRADQYPLKYGSITRTELSQMVFLFSPELSGGLTDLSRELRSLMKSEEIKRLELLYSKISQPRSEIRSMKLNSKMEVNEAPAVSVQRAHEFSRALSEIHEILKRPEFKDYLPYAPSIIQGLSKRDFRVMEGPDGNKELRKAVEVWAVKISKNFPDIVPFMYSSRLFGDLLFNENGEAILLFGNSEAGKGSLGYAFNRMSGGRVKISSTDDILLIRIPGHLLAATATFPPSIRARAYDSDHFLSYEQYLGVGPIKAEFRLEGAPFKSEALNPGRSHLSAYMKGLFPSFGDSALTSWDVTMVEEPMVIPEDFEKYALKYLQKVEGEKRSELRTVNEFSKLEVAKAVTAKILGLDVMKELFARMFLPDAVEPETFADLSQRAELTDGYSKLFKTGAAAVLPASVILNLSEKAQTEYFDLIYQGFKQTGGPVKTSVYFAGEGAGELKNKMFQLKFFKLNPEASKIFEVVLQDETVAASRRKNDAVSVSVTAEPEDMSALYRMPSFLIPAAEIGQLSPGKAFLYIHHLTQLQLLAAAQLKRDLGDVVQRGEYARLMGEFLNKVGIEFAASGGLVTPSMNSLLSETLAQYLRTHELVSASA